jgi:hypothetical protein
MSASRNHLSNGRISVIRIVLRTHTARRLTRRFRVAHKIFLNVAPFHHAIRTRDDRGVWIFRRFAADEDLCFTRIPDKSRLALAFRDTRFFDARASPRTHTGIAAWTLFQTATADPSAFAVALARQRRLIERRRIRICSTIFIADIRLAVHASPPSETFASRRFRFLRRVAETGFNVDVAFIVLQTHFVDALLARDTREPRIALARAVLAALTYAVLAARRSVPTNDFVRGARFDLTTRAAPTVATFARSKIGILNVVVAVAESAAI